MSYLLKETHSVALSHCSGRTDTLHRTASALKEMLEIPIKISGLSGKTDFGTAMRLHSLRSSSKLFSSILPLKILIAVFELASQLHVISDMCPLSMVPDPTGSVVLIIAVPCAWGYQFPKLICVIQKTKWTSLLARASNQHFAESDTEVRVILPPRLHR